MSRRAPVGLRARGSVGLFDALALSALAVFTLGAWTAAYVATATTAGAGVRPHIGPVPAPARVLERRTGYGAIATWTEADKTLRVTDQLSADALLCIRRAGVETCKLTAEWVAR